MTKDFQQQAPLNNLGFRKSTPAPQHGQPADKGCAVKTQTRSFLPRPGH